MKKKTNIKTIIRQIVREEVAMAIHEVITELKQPTQQKVSQPKSKKKIVEKIFKIYDFNDLKYYYSVLHQLMKNKTIDNNKVFTCSWQEFTNIIKQNKIFQAYVID